MKHNEKDKTLLRRYLDDLYTVEDVSKLADHLAVPEPEGILEELAADVWDESASQQPLTDLEREKSKKEARQLLKRIEHKKRTWFRRMATVAAAAAAGLCPPDRVLPKPGSAHCHPVAYPDTGRFLIWKPRPLMANASRCCFLTARNWS